MSYNYSEWTILRLRKEIEKIEKTIELKEKEEKKEVLEKLRLVAKQNGYDLNDVLAADTSRKGSPRIGITIGGDDKDEPKRIRTRSPAKIKYINPINTAETWTGRGRKPRWVVEYLNAGGQLSGVAV